MIIADSHEFIELYRGDKDLRMGIEMLRIRDDLRFISFAPDRPSPNDARQFGIARTADGPVPELPPRFDLRLLKSMSVRFAAKESGGIMSFMPDYPSQLIAAKPDVVFENPFTWLTPRSYQTWRAARKMGVPVVYYDPGDDIPISPRQRVLAPIEKPVVRSAAHIITYNEAGKARFEKKYGCPSAQVSVIPKPVDVDACRYSGDVRELRDQITGGNPDALVVAYLGRLAQYKGSAVLLEVAKKAENDPRFRDVRFVFIGGALTSSETDAQYSGPNIHVTGMLAHDEVARYVAAVDAMVFPDVTRPGAFPTAVAEAMAAGRALVVGTGARTDCLPLVDGVSALVVAPRSPDAVLDSVLRLAQDRSRMLVLGDAAGRFARSQMDYSVVARRYLEIAEGVRSGC